MLYLLESEDFCMLLEEEKEVLEETPAEPEKVEEETKVEESKEEKPQLPENVVEINKPSKEDKPYDEVIEEARLDFNKFFRKGRIRSYIIMGVVFVVAAASVFCITFNQIPALKIVGWSLIGAALVGMIVYYIVTRNSMPNATKKYIAVVNKELNERNFSDTKYQDVTTDTKEKLELSEPLSDNIYAALNNIASRNVINGHFAGRSFKVCDLGLYTGSGKQRASAFVGKYISLPNDLHFEGRYIINIKGATPVDLPTDIADLVVLSEEDGLTIYGKEGAKFASDLGKDFLKAIKEISVKESLLGLNIVIWGGHSSAYASYDDAVMTLPFEKPFNKTANEKYAHDLLAIMDAFALLVKKEK